MKIIRYDKKYRNDAIFMVLEAKNAIGAMPRLNDDLLDIQGHYFDKGDMFWLAVDENDRVIGTVGFNVNENRSEATLHRLFVKCTMKRQGIGTLLLETAESCMKNIGIDIVYINLGIGEQWFESRSFYKKHGYNEYAPNKMKKSGLQQQNFLK